MNDIVHPKFGIGAPVRRKEDPAFLTGRGHFVADHTPAGTLHAYVLRSPMAHARFRITDIEAAQSAPGVHLVMTANDVADLGPLPCRGVARQSDGSLPEIPDHPVLCRDVVRYVGDAVAFVVADSVDNAKTAAELIEIDFDPLDATVDPARALSDDAVRVWPERTSNLAFDFLVGDREKTDRAFDTAERISRLRIVNNRVVANYMETRGCVAEYDAADDRLTLTVGSQGVHSMHAILANTVLRIAPEKLRVRTPDVGGGFGTKMFVFREYPLACVAAKHLNRPVKWIGERSEGFLGDSHARDHLTTAELAMDSDGRFLALRVETIANMGAYLNQFGPFIPWIGATMMTGVYDIPVAVTHIQGVFTHTVPVDAYRGAGRPEAAYLIERLVDVAAGDIGVSPLDIRRRNMIRADQMPYTTPTGRMYDTGDYRGHLDRALEVADWAGFDARLADSAGRGRWRGIGVATYVEACAFAGSEGAEVRLEQDGSLSVLIGTMSNGQGHATAYGQIVAGHFGVGIDKVTLIQGDTDVLAKGGGTGGSRSIPLGLPSVDIASRTLADRLKDLASDRLEAAPADLELRDGMVRVVGTDQAVSLAELARTSERPEMLSADGIFEQGEATYPNGSHVCEVEIDPETGVTDIVGYTIVDDFGVTVNPLLLQGQVVGGVAQGVGQALMEEAVYDEDGQLITASLLDYCVPRAADLPALHFETRNVPSTTNIMGIKGAGEAGTIGSAPAVINAIVDALHRRCGITHIDMPATPMKVWQAIRAARDR